MYFKGIIACTVHPSYMREYLIYSSYFHLSNISLIRSNCIKNTSNSIKNTPNRRVNLKTENFSGIYRQLSLIIIIIIIVYMHGDSVTMAKIQKTSL